LAGGSISFDHLGDLPARDAGKELPTLDLPSVADMRRITLSRLTRKLGGCIRPTAFLPSFENFPSWDCVIYYPPSKPTKNHDFIFVQASIQSVRLHESPEDATIWDDTKQAVLDTKVGHIHKSLLPRVKIASTLRPFLFWRWFLIF